MRLFRIKICWVTAWLLIVLLPHPTPADPGRSLSFQHFIPEQSGRPVIGISSMLQDRQGFLWFGTGMGLARYDGYSFKFFPFSTDHGVEETMPTVYPIFEDSRGDIWIGTAGIGLFQFKRESGSYNHFLHIPGVPNCISGNIVLAIQEDSGGDLWIGTRLGGLNHFDRDSMCFSHIPLDPQTETVWTLFIDSDGYIWAGTDKKGLFRLHPIKRDVMNFRNDPRDKSSLGGNSVWAIYQDSQQTIWVGTNKGGLNRFNPAEKNFTRCFDSPDSTANLRDTNITTICEDETGVIWIGTSTRGIKLFNRDNSRFLAYVNDRNDPDSLSDNHITSILMDASGIMWIGTVKGGVNKCLNNLTSFDHFKHNPANPDSLDHNNVLSLLSDRNGMLWVGTSTGLNRVDSTKRRVIHYTLDNRSGASPPLDRIQTIFEDKDDFIWFGSSGGLLNRVHPLSGEINRYQLSDKVSKLAPLSYIYTIQNDTGREEILLLGTNRGILRFNRNNATFSPFPFPLSPTTDLNHCHILSLMVESNGDIWAGSGRNGLFLLKRGARIWERYGYDLRDMGKGLSHNTVYTMYRDRSDRMWIGTGGGLSLFPGNIGSWRNFSSRQGLPGDTVFSIQEDTKGYLWLGTNQGLARFDPREVTFTRYETTSGVQGNLFNPGASAQDKNGSLLFGGTNGYNSFDPDQLVPHPYIPPLAWTGFSINNQPVNPGRPLSEIDRLKISYKNRSITFEFSALFFLNPASNRYAYLLEGRDADWNPAFSDNTISFSNLGRGEYLLRVRCANPDGIWNPDEFQLSLTVIPPFWGTTAARILFLSTAFLLVAIWYKKRGSKRGKSDESLVANLDRLIRKIPITTREEEIVRLVIRGESNKEIARRLYISNSTVRNHIYNIYQKLKVKNRLDLINLIQKQK